MLVLETSCSEKLRKPRTKCSFWKLLYYFVVRSSTGVVLCGMCVVRSSTGVVLGSTE